MKPTFLSNLNEKIESVRTKMYEAYENGRSYEELLKISQELDDLLNRLEEINK
ncbi:aspartyl-phosphate phosphatase Spo0E family protein [Halobacillus litoralis]|uniref:aspartyl-phosphate phosphatase Spo0E family protein n=1 Tax=Halobacillus litoralis TaxID=45668 RepID=UPI001CD42334|nr:aspartyl-phosphate phosphatase Spo0E family protein [Halobacillus litoralis]MCA1022388.1 aspartyl-phosphate phosphatase Spo0E family protein [Halobacillus litoralis]